MGSGLIFHQPVRLSCAWKRGESELFTHPWPWSCDPDRDFSGRHDELWVFFSKDNTVYQDESPSLVSKVRASVKQVLVLTCSPMAD